MMGSEIEESRLYASKEEMESLILDDDDSLTGKSYSSYKSAVSTLSDSRLHHHPLAPPISATPADTDPLLSPPPPPPPNHANVRSPNSLNNSHVEAPPPYSDVIFSPLDRDDRDDEFEVNGVESPSKDSEESTVVLPRSQSLSSEYLKIAVSNPQKEVEGSNSLVPGANTYVTYLITTRTNVEDYGGSDFLVRRRFRDVVTLSDRLSEAYRGFFIPPRPDKSVVESQMMHKQEFVEQRRVALERYLRRLAAHPVIRKSDELRVFLQVQGKLPLPTSTDVASRMLDGAVKLPKQLLGDSGSVMGPQDVVQPAKGGRDLLRIFKELKQSMTNDWGGSRPPVEEEDKEFLEKKERMRNLEQQIISASQQAESLVKAQQDMGDTMGGLGLAFIKLTKFENENAVLNTQRIRASDMKNVATAAVKASRFYRGLNTQTVEHLDTLHDYLGLMLAVDNAFSDRSSALLTVQTLVSELSSLHSKAEKFHTASSKVFGGDNNSRFRKMEELKEAIRVTEDAKNCAIRQYERIKENNRSEIERIDRERKDEFVNMLKGFVVSQVAYMEKIGNEWAKVVEDTSQYAKDSA